MLEQSQQALLRCSSNPTVAANREGRTRATTGFVTYCLPPSFLPLLLPPSVFSSVERKRDGPTSLRMRGGAPVGGWPWLGTS